MISRNVLHRMLLVCAIACCWPSWLPGEESTLATELTQASQPTSAQKITLIAGDEIRVEVYDNQDLDQDLRISRDPINFPLIGDIGSLVGLTTSAIQQLITTKLADGYIKRPVVTVTVRTFAARTAAVLGSVKNPQRIDLSPFSTATALQAIAQAGGLTDEANQQMVTIIRRVDADAPAELIQVAMGGTGGDNVLRPGDVILVPRNDRLYVMGEVEKEGPVAIDSDQAMTVSRAISVAGGFKRYAKRSKVQLIRDGQTIVVDVAAILAGTSNTDPVVKPGDSLFIPDSLF